MRPVTEKLTVFNMLEPNDPIRARVFMEILKFLKNQSMFESLRQYLDKLPEGFSFLDLGGCKHLSL